MNKIIPTSFMYFALLEIGFLFNLWTVDSLSPEVRFQHSFILCLLLFALSLALFHTKGLAFFRNALHSMGVCGFNWHLYKQCEWINTYALYYRKQTVCYCYYLTLNTFILKLGSLNWVTFTAVYDLYLLKPFLFINVNHVIVNLMTIYSRIFHEF